MSEAHLGSVRLGGANLSGTNVSGASLIETDLNGVEGWTIAQLEQAKEITGCVMPDGTKLACRAMPNRPAVEGPTFAEWKAKQKDEG